MMAPAAKLSISVAATIIMAGCISSDNVEVTSEAPPLPPAAESYSINSRGDSIKEPYQCEYTSARDYHGQEREYRGNHRPWWDPSGWGASGDGSDQVTMNVGDRDNIRIVIVGEGADFKSFWLEIDPAFKIISGETQASEAYPSREKIVQIFEIEVEAITATGWSGIAGGTEYYFGDETDSRMYYCEWMEYFIQPTLEANQTANP